MQQRTNFTNLDQNVNKPSLNTSGAKQKGTAWSQESNIPGRSNRAASYGTAGVKTQWKPEKQNMTEKKERRSW